MLVLAAAFGWLAAGAPASARDCRLQQFASLDMTTEADGAVSVPMTINGHTGLVLIDTGSVQSSIAGSLARQLGMPITDSESTYSFVGGVRIDKTTTVDTLELGTLTTKKFPMLVLPSKVLHDDTIGMLGPDILQNYDVEFDFAAGKFNLFSPEHCANQVVYWTQAAYAEVPLHLDHGGHLLIDVVLNGKSIQAGVDTGAFRSAMTMSVAQSVFGIAPGDPGLTQLGTEAINGTRPVPVYHYPFSAVQFAGVSVLNPDIELLGADRFDTGGPQLILGVSTLRQLHVYVAYDERKLYLTPAEQR
jgi:predicted aspartyl protease